MSQLEWKRIEYSNGEYEIIGKDRMFAYRFRERETQGQIDRYSTNSKTFYYKHLTMLVRRLDEVEWFPVGIPTIIVALRRSIGGSITDEDVLHKLPCLENQIWINRPKEMLEAIERWLEDYGYLKTLKKYKEEN